MNRKQYEKFTKDQLLDELMKFGNMNDQFAALNKKLITLVKAIIS